MTHRILGGLLLLCVLATLVQAYLGIWTGDNRWGASAVPTAVVGLLVAGVWFAVVLEEVD